MFKYSSHGDSISENVRIRSLNQSFLGCRKRLVLCLCVYVFLCECVCMCLCVCQVCLVQIYMGPDCCKWGRRYASGLMARRSAPLIRICIVLNKRVSPLLACTCISRNTISHSPCLHCNSPRMHTCKKREIPEIYLRNFFLDFPQNFRLRTRNQYCTQAIA